MNPAAQPFELHDGVSRTGILGLSDELPHRSLIDQYCDQICPTCVRALLKFSKFERFGDGHQHHLKIRDLKLSAARGCFLCETFWSEVVHEGLDSCPPQATVIIGGEASGFPKNAGRLEMYLDCRGHRSDPSNACNNGSASEDEQTEETHVEETHVEETDNRSGSTTSDSSGQSSHAFADFIVELLTEGRLWL